VVRIERGLVDGRWAPGERLPSERQLAGELAVSRTVVREALKTVEHLGLIEVLPRVGAFNRAKRDRVVGAGANERSDQATTWLLDCLEARKVLECGSAELLVRRATAIDIAHLEVLMEESRGMPDDAHAIEIDKTFHIELHRATRNQFIAASVERYMALFWTHLPVVMAVPMRRERSWQQHRGVLDALKARDAETLRRRMAAHLDSLGRGIGPHARDRRPRNRHVKEVR
jgi:GntR family transcriptional repressor for pyruvate dehydrogenase complex